MSGGAGAINSLAQTVKIFLKAFGVSQTINSLKKVDNSSKELLNGLSQLEKTGKKKVLDNLISKNPTRTSKHVEQIGNAVQTTVKRFDESGRLVGHSIGKATTEIKRFNFGFLSTMFFGMQLQRTFGGLFKSMKKGFKEVAGKTHPVNIAMTRLSANTRFLQFALMDAFGPAMFDSLADFADWMANLDPKKLKNIATSVLYLAGLGTVAFTVSQIALVLQGLPLIGGATWSAFSKAAGAYTWPIIIGAALSMIATVKLTFKLFQKDKNTLLERLGVVIATALSGLFIGLISTAGATTAAGLVPFILVGAGIGVALNLLDITLEEGLDFMKPLKDIREMLNLPSLSLGKTIMGVMGFDEASGFSELKNDIDSLEGGFDEASVKAEEFYTNLDPLTTLAFTNADNTERINTALDVYVKAAPNIIEQLNYETEARKANAGAAREEAMAIAAKNKVEEEDLTSLESLQLGG